MKKASFPFFLFVFFLLAGAAAAEPIEEVFGDWALRCSEESTACILEQRVFVEGSEKAPLMHMAVQKLQVVENGNSARSLWVTIRVPLGIKLAPGLQVKIDSGENQAVSLHHCRANGCISLLPLSPDLRSRLESGLKAFVTFQALNGRAISVPVSLSGFTAGMNALENKETPP